MKIEFKKLAALFLLAAISLSTYATASNGCNAYPCSEYYVLYENVVVRPHFTRNNAYFLVDPSGIQGQTAVMFDWDFQYSPRIELGWIKECGTGLRGRYWRFNNDTTLDASNENIAAWFAEDLISPEIGFDGATKAVFRHCLEIDVVDLEASWRRCNWTYSAGGRYTRIYQRYTGTELAPDSDRLEAKHHFEGGGLTTAVEFFQPFWCGFSFFTKTRGSFLYGDSRFAATNPNDSGSAVRSSNDHDLLAIGELQLGLDWRRSFCNVCTFLRFAIETQYWVGGGSGGPDDNAVYDEGNYQTSNPQDSNLGFFGFNIALGLVF